MKSGRKVNGEVEWIRYRRELHLCFILDIISEPFESVWRNDVGFPKHLLDGSQELIFFSYFRAHHLLKRLVRKSKDAAKSSAPFLMESVAFPKSLRYLTSKNGNSLPHPIIGNSVRYKSWLK